MKAKLIKIIERDGSQNGANKCYIICMKAEDGTPYKSWTDDRLGNFKRWYNLIVGFIGAQNRGEEVWLDGLIVRRPGEVDADSQFKVEITKSSEPFIPNHHGVKKTETDRKDQS